MPSVIYRARWLLPIEQPPVENAWFEIAGGRIVAVGRSSAPGAVTDLGDVAVLPGLVNAHTHLELSWMAGLVPPSGTMHDWIRTVMRVRRAGPAGGPAAEQAAIEAGADAMRATGTVLAGDISNLFTTPGVLRHAGLGGIVFYELLGFNAADPAGLVRQAWQRVHEAEVRLEAVPPGEGRPSIPIRGSVVAHAPYSVSPALFGEIAKASDRVPLSVHLAESPEEVEFLRSGRGPIRAVLEDLGVWTDTWRVPECDPVQYIAGLKYLRPGTLVVHGVYLTDDGLERLRRAKAIVVTCPRSNEWVGAGLPRLSHFYASGVPVAVGTDSLASAPSLSVFDELAEMRRLAPEVAAASLLESATRVGARALRMDRDFGTIAPGKRAELVTVDLPGHLKDVEEYLVGGVAADAIRRFSG